MARDQAGRKLAWFPNDILPLEDRWSIKRGGPLTPFPTRPAGTLEEGFLCIDPWETSTRFPSAQEGDALGAAIAELWQTIGGQ